MIYGYARCSTSEDRQDINRQKRELAKLGVDEKNIYFEYASGTVKDRTELNRLLNTVKQGDTIAVTEVSRLTRTTAHLCEILSFIQEKHLQLLIGSSFDADCRNEQINSMTKGMIMMWGVFAEMERDMIAERIRSGMENAKAKGKTLGRPKITKEDLPDKFWKYLNLYNEGKINKSDFARLIGVSRPTLYVYLDMVQGEEKELVALVGHDFEYVEG